MAVWEDVMSAFHTMDWAYVVFAVAVAATGYLMLLRRRSRHLGSSGRDNGPFMKYRVVSSAICNADPRLSWPCMQLAAALRAGEVSAVDILELYIAQLEAVDPHLNACVDQRYDDARKEARAADIKLTSARKRGPKALRNLESLTPLLGVPWISKATYEYPGLSYTGGIVGRAYVVAENVNPVVGRLERAGAIMLCTGNTSEGCMWAESNNLVHGCSNNPYDLSRTCGGSSGGNGSLLSALCGSFALTSDVAGSTRIPALYNGLFGHKPTGGAVPNMRSLPQPHGYVERYCQLGPLTRNARDLMPLLKLIAGPMKDDDFALVQPIKEEERKILDSAMQLHRSFDWKDPHEVDLKHGTKFFVMWDQPGAVLGLVRRRHACQIEAQQRAVAALEHNLGIQVKEVKFDQFKKSFDIWAAMLHNANPIPFEDVISEGKEQISPLWETFKWVLTWGRHSDHTLPALLLTLGEKITKLTPVKNAEMVQLGEQLRDEINDLLGKNGVMICPSLPTPAPRHGPFPNLLFFADFAACGIFNCMELPVTAVPMGLSKKEHLPVGIQVVAGNGNDHLTIAVAEALEVMGEAKWTPPKFL